MATQGLTRAAPSPSLRRTCAVASVVLDAQDERVALRRAGVPRQRVLQRRDELVAVAGHHAVIVVGCAVPMPSFYSET